MIKSTSVPKPYHTRNQAHSRLNNGRGRALDSCAFSSISCDRLVPLMSSGHLTGPQAARTVPSSLSRREARTLREERNKRTAPECFEAPRNMLQQLRLSGNTIAAAGTPGSAPPWSPADIYLTSFWPRVRLSGIFSGFWTQWEGRVQ